jgi:hypothetical protein
MLPEENQNVAPADDAYLLYAMLTPENKEKVKKFIAGLKETQ